MLRQQLQNIRHQSALHVVCKSKQQKTIQLPFPGIEASICEFKKRHNSLSDEQEHGDYDDDGGIHPGDTMVLFGKSGTGKTYILSRILNDSISRQWDVVYIDLEHQYDSTATLGNSHINQHGQYVHLFRPRTGGDLLGLIYRLEKWFYDRSGDSNTNVVWVMIDGEWDVGDKYQHGQDLKRKLVEKLKALQHLWSFALIATYRSKMLVAEGGPQQQQQMTRCGQEYWFECYKSDQTICMKLGSTWSNHAYPVDDLNSMVTIIG